MVRHHQHLRLAVMLYVRYPLSLRQVEDLLFERGIDISHETIRYWWNRFGPLLAGEIRNRLIKRRNYSNWRWHLDEVFVRINGERQYLWRAGREYWQVGRAFHLGALISPHSTRRKHWCPIPQGTLFLLRE